MNIEIGQRKIQDYGTHKVLLCRCDKANAAFALPKKIKASFCDLCGIEPRQTPTGVRYAFHEEHA